MILFLLLSVLPVKSAVIIKNSGQINSDEALFNSQFKSRNVNFLKDRIAIVSSKINKSVNRNEDIKIFFRRDLNPEGKVREARAQNENQTYFNFLLTSPINKVPTYNKLVYYFEDFEMYFYNDTVGILNRI